MRGRTILKIIDRHKRVNPLTSMLTLDAHIKDALGREYLILNPEIAAEAIPGEAEFGGLIKAFAMAPALYTRTLVARITEKRNLGIFTAAELSDLFLGCEAVTDAECQARHKVSLLEYLNADQLGFYYYAAERAVRYVESAIEREIEQALPGWLADEKERERHQRLDPEYA